MSGASPVTPHLASYRVRMLVYNFCVLLILVQLLYGITCFSPVESVRLKNGVSVTT
jgi:hypothetical protein